MAPGSSRRSALTSATAAIMSEPPETQLGPEPIALFQTWFEEAVAAGAKEPTAMALATVDESGRPDVRTVLMKGVDEGGFVFYTNLGSAKAKALQHDPRVALCFYWDKIDKQIRVRGR